MFRTTTDTAHSRDAEESSIPRSFASPADHALCRDLHRRHGTSYYFATHLFPRSIRRHTHAVYGFVRTPDDWVGHGLPTESLRRRLQNYRAELKRAVEGIRPSFPVLRAFSDTLHETRIPLDEPLLFLDSMEQDLHISRYPTFENLRRYMRGSAGSVGCMMCAVMGADLSATGVQQCAIAMGEAMQLTNFLRDVGEDARRGRIYLPLEDLRSFGVSEEDLLLYKMTPGVVDLLRFEVERARALYRVAEEGIELLPRRSRRAVRVASVLYSRILSRVEQQDYDVFRERARTSRTEKLSVAARICLGLSR